MAFADQIYQQNSKEILTPNIDTNMKQELSNDTVHVWAHLLPGQVYELLSSEVKIIINICLHHNAISTVLLKSYFH